MRIQKGFPDFTLFYVVQTQTQNEGYTVFINTKKDF